MKLVELIPALQTSPETLRRAELYARACGKDPAISRDDPGFISNRILMPFLNEAVIVLESASTGKELFAFSVAHGWSRVSPPRRTLTSHSSWA
jgi:3-hydroxybutyryl-CoA dehydrogenase